MGRHFSICRFVITIIAGLISKNMKRNKVITEVELGG